MFGTEEAKGAARMAEHAMLLRNGGQEPRGAEGRALGAVRLLQGALAKAEAMNAELQLRLAAAEGEAEDMRGMAVSLSRRRAPDQAGRLDYEEAVQRMLERLWAPDMAPFRAELLAMLADVEAAADGMFDAAIGEGA